MSPGPILARELLVAARSPRTYSTRALLTIGFLAGFCAIYEGYRIYYGRDLSIQHVATMARQSFFMAIAVQGIATLMIVPQLVCGAIAREKDGKTLGFLLGTPLDSAEIVLGKLAARLIRYVASMASIAPALFLLTLLGGTEPAAVALADAATFSTAITLGSFAILASTLCRGTKQATQLTALFVGVWIFVPFLLGFGFLIFPMGRVSAIRPVVDWALASSPLFFSTSILSIIVGGVSRFSWLDGVLTMIGLQAILSSAFVAAATWRLRPSYRDQEGNSRRTLLQRLRAWRWRFFRKPPVGADPVFWRETSTSTTHGIAKLLGCLVSASIVAILAYHAARFAIPAGSEALGGGYRGGQDPSRLRFSLYLRIVSALAAPILLAFIGGSIAVSVASEKERETWLGLIATPLSGREILRPKRLAAVYSARFAVAGLLILWLVGLAVGSLHPLGLLAGLILFGSWTLLTLGLGSWFSTRVAVSGNASGSAPGILVLLWLVPPMLNSYEPLRTMLNATACFPWLLYITLVSYPDATIFLGGGPDGGANPGGVFFGSGRRLVEIVASVGIIAPGVVGWFLIRLADSTFDRLAGRPIRPRPGGADLAHGR